jgi:hypothetical protein
VSELLVFRGTLSVSYLSEQPGDPLERIQSGSTFTDNLVEAI